jgi:hypothetical protein
MKKSVKIVLAAAIALPIIVVAAIPLFVNANTFRPTIESRLSTTLSRLRRAGLGDRGNGGESKGCLSGRCRTAYFGDTPARYPAIQYGIDFDDTRRDEFGSLLDLQRERRGDAVS